MVAVSNLTDFRNLSSLSHCLMMVAGFKPVRFKPLPVVAVSNLTGFLDLLGLSHYLPGGWRSQTWQVFETCQV